MSFTDPIVGGTTLIRDAIHSANYSAGTAGWTINADGTAEFNNVTVRGSLVVASASGAGVTAFGTATTAEIDLQPPTGTFPYGPARLFTELIGTSPQLTVTGPTVGGAINATGGSLQMRADVATKKPIVTLTGDQIILGANVPLSTITVKAPFTEFQHDMIVDGQFFAGNRVTGNVSITPSAVNVPTSTVVTFNTPLTGTQFTCQVSANSTVPGTQVTGVSYTGLSATGVTLWLTRSNPGLTPTNLSYTVEGF